MRELPSDVGKIHLQELPHQCPFCHKNITPNALYGHKNELSMEVFMYCPECGQAFIGHYKVTPTNQYIYRGMTTGGTVAGKDFSRTIKRVSPAFVTIYNQALAAEQQNLTEIGGVGYRKALEILIKDYALLKHPQDEEKIEKRALGQAIEEFVDDVRVINVARRAAWIGFEEVQYIKKWEGKNLQELKKVIDLTIHWIEMEELTLSFESQ
ncbi:MAG TPA: hypothetical protein VD908_01100 [Cytophagales bacterium]|nr:hypothetical protein [Cytophagales bacterium]